MTAPTTTPPPAPNLPAYTLRLRDGRTVTVRGVSPADARERWWRATGEMAISADAQEPRP